MDWSLEYLHPLWLTIKIAAIATGVGGTAGILIAAFLARARFPGRDLLDAMLTLPLVLPPTVLGYYLIVLLGRRGVIGRYLLETFDIAIMFTWQGAVVAAVLVTIPLIIKSAKTAFENVDQNLEDAARTLGKNETAVFLLISLPLAWRGIAAGALLAFARAMGEFGATLMIAGNIPGKTQTLSMAVYDAVQSGDNGRVTILVFIALFVCTAILYGSGKLLSR